MKLSAAMLLALAVASLPFTALGAQAEDELICGQARVINATIRDAGGNLVSDHTRVEFVTNHGGVLAGTAGTPDPLTPGYVAPLSSTFAETFNGIATVTLITSAEDAGPYEVVISTGGSTGVRQVPPLIYSPGGTAPNASAVFPQPVYQPAYFPAGPPVTAQVTVTCRLP